MSLMSPWEKRIVSWKWVETRATMVTALTGRPEVGRVLRRLSSLSNSASKCWIPLAWLVTLVTAAVGLEADAARRAISERSGDRNRKPTY